MADQKRPHIAAFFQGISIIGFAEAGEEVRAMIEKLEGVAQTDLLQTLDALGEGEYCGVLSLFGPYIVRPLASEQFVKDQLPGWERAIEVGSDATGRCLVVGPREDSCRFYIVDWKHDEVIAYPSFEASLNGLMKLSGRDALCSCPFYLGPRAIKVAFDVMWDFEVMVDLVKRAMPLGLRNREHGKAEGCWQTYVEELNLIVEVSGGEGQNCVWYCPEDQIRKASMLCERWLALAREEGLDAPAISYGEWQ